MLMEGTGFMLWTYDNDIVIRSNPRELVCGAWQADEKLVREIDLDQSDEYDDPYTLEYREGGADRHFQCTRDLSKVEVEAAFLKYLRRDTSWKTDFSWKQLENKPWWKFW